MATATSSSFADGRYTVERVVGRGGMSTVYLARDRELDRPVAVKVLAESFGGDEEFVYRFRREAQTAARLAHPNIVQVFDAGEEGERLFIVMEYVDGESLGALRSRLGRLEPSHVLDVGEQACAALGYAHGNGVVHRDVKPGNLLVRRDGTLKVTDFGIARAADTTQLTQAGTILGTASYVAPEQARGEPVGPEADIFSLGIVLYEIVTGTVPWKIESVAQLATIGEGPVRPVGELAPEAPPELEETIMRCLTRDPRDRPGSAAEVAALLRGGRPAPTAMTVALPRAEEPPEDATARLPRGERRVERRPVGPADYRRRRLALLAALLVAVALVALVVALARGGDDDGQPDDPAPGQVEPVPTSDDPAEQARELEAWLREHTDEN
jgi:eukaryotic-like serine/threonine-protein kinase